jgi:hypothetical protein
VLVMMVSIAVAAAMPAAMGVTLAQMSVPGAMMVGAASNLAGQLVGNLVGVQKGFNFRSFATSVISAGRVASHGRAPRGVRFSRSGWRDMDGGCLSV